MAFANRSKNAFAALIEENQVFRKKEKKERAQHRKALQEAAAPPPKPESEYAEVGKNVKWSDVLDDDDDFDDYRQKQQADSEVSSSSSEDENEIEDEDEDDEVVKSIVIEKSTVIKPTKIPNEERIKNETLRISNTNRPMSKKEREVHEQKEKAEFEALLNDLGLVPKNEVLLSVETISPETIKENGDDSINTKAKQKKKKKKKDNILLTTTESAEELPPPQTITREQALAAAKKLTTANRKSSTKSSQITETVLAEAKKRAELKKAKQKRDKYMFEH